MRKIVRKRRTREHVIADLGVNHVERFVLRCGHTVERYWHDYGFDLLVNTYNDDGEYENGDLRMQVRATERFKTVDSGRAISCRLESAHLRHWLGEAMPVILVVYDAERDAACWIYVQRHFAPHVAMPVDLARETVSTRIPVGNILNEDAVRRFRHFRNSVLVQTQGVIRHHE